MKKKILIILLSCTALAMRAQEFTIKKVELDGTKINVYYDLVDSIAGRSYTINIYSSRDNFIAPLAKVTGDLGLEVRPGGNRKITWNAQEELGATFEGKVGLEVRGRLYIPFVRFSGFEDYKVLKRGKPYQLIWSGGTRQNVLNFDLYKNDEKIYTIPNVANVGNHEVIIPTSVKPGIGYKFKISDSKNKDEVVYTSSFMIKRKVPLLVKLLPVLGLGAAATLLSSGGSSGTPKGQESIVDPLIPIR
ncbi:MAG: GPI anchored serine-threonine rich family protein [Cyclobacteriaceae bacterium]|nr:GPI anchored serine-threonine rich family protein [Cyclobacteriaceae bacterium]